MKELKISTKLASAVLGKEVTECSLINKTRNSINITYFEDKEDFDIICIEWNSIELNIYEFAYKWCKEWAENKGYIIFSKNKECLIYSIDEVYDVIECLSQYEDYFEADSEVQSIIKACNWILEQNK